jgi:hypothetical protein
MKKCVTAEKRQENEDYSGFIVRRSEPMSEQKVGFYFSCDADGSPNDHTIYVEQRNEGTVTLGARYKNSEPNHLYEIEMDADDLQAFGQMCLALAQQMRENAKPVHRLPDPRLYDLRNLLSGDDRLRGLQRPGEAK